MLHLGGTRYCNFRRLLNSQPPIPSRGYCTLVQCWGINVVENVESVVGLGKRGPHHHQALAPIALGLTAWAVRAVIRLNGVHKRTAIKPNQPAKEFERRGGAKFNLAGH